MLHHHGQYFDVFYPGRTPLPVNLGPGHFGVELFFIISGFVILMTIEQKQDLRAFVVSRIARLMPAFLAALVLASAIYHLWPMPPLESPMLRQFLANLTMAPSLLGESSVDLPYWTLTYELLFYTYMAVLLRFRLLGSIEWLALLAMAIGCLVSLTMDMQLHRRTGIILLLNAGNFFVIGICLYRIYAGAARPITYFTLAFAAAVTAIGGGEHSFYAPGDVYLPLTVAFGGLVWFATSRHGRWLAWPPLVFLGKISYPLYLVHVAVGWEVIRFGQAHGWSTMQGVIAAAIASVAIATVLRYFVEAPGMRWSRPVLQGRRAIPVGRVPQTAER